MALKEETCSVSLCRCVVGVSLGSESLCNATNTSTETEKYAHVTFFFNGGREAAFEGEDREMVPSPKVATYDLKPEMSCEGVALAVS